MTNLKEKKLIGVFFKMNPSEKKKLKLYCVHNDTNITDVIKQGIELVMMNKQKE